MSIDWSVIFREFPRICKDYYGFSENYTIQLLFGIKDVKGIISLFDNISSSDKGKIEDLLAEIRFIYLFKNCGWTVEKIPKSAGPTPDLKVMSDFFSSLIEIKNIRWRNPGPSTVNNNTEQFLLEEHGDFCRDEEKIRDKVFEAVDQIYFYKDRDPNDIPIIALWSSDGEIEEIDVKFSMQRIIDEMRDQKPDFPNGILIFGNGWIYQNMKYLPYPIPIREPFNHKLQAIASKITSISIQCN